MTKNELLYKKAAKSIAESYINNVYESTEKTELSFPHESRMKALFNKKNILYVLYRIPKRALVIVLVCAVLLATPLSVKAIRNPLFEFFANLFKNEIHLQIDETSPIEQCPRTIEEEYSLEYIPTGYELKDKTVSSSELKLYYGNGEKTFIFTQSVLESYDIVIPKQAAVTNDNIIINGFEGKSYKYDGTYVIIWANDEYLLKVEADDGLSESKLFKVAEGVTGGAYSNELDYLQDEQKEPLSENSKPSSTTISRDNFSFIIPDGLHEVDASAMDDMLIIMLQDGNQGQIILQISGNQGQISVYNTDAQYQLKQLTDELAVYEKPSFPGLYTWQDEKYFYLINSYSESTSQETIEELIKSLY